MLASVAKPAGQLTAPTFELLGAIARAPLPTEIDGSAQGRNFQLRPGIGEPSIAAAPDGTLYVAFPGCDTAPLRGPFVDRLPVADALPLPDCEAPPLYRSTDNGVTWERLNHPENGRLAPDAPVSNGDGIVAVDAAGSVYVTALGPAGIESQRSDDGGDTWVYTGNVFQEGSTVDRQWMAATGRGHVIHNWWAPQDGVGRFAFRTTFDGGATYFDQGYFHEIGTDAGNGAFHEGPPQFSADGSVAYIPFPVPREDTYDGGVAPVGIHVARSADGGLTWEPIDTGLDATTFGSMDGFLTLAATSDGHLAIAFQDETADPTGGVSRLASAVKVTFSTNERDWREPLAVSTSASVMFAWIAAGAGDRVAVSYLASDAPDLACDGVWDLRTAIVDLDEGIVADALVEPRVHVGGFQDSACPDRRLLDYLQNTVLPDGRLAIAYPATSQDGGFTEIRVAIQDGGSRMLARAER